MANYPEPRKPAKTTQLVTMPEMQDAMEETQETEGWEFELDPVWRVALGGEE